MDRAKKITKEMALGEIIEQYPKTVFLFEKYGLSCLECPISQEETMEEAAEAHQLDLEKFLEDLNKTIEK
jgi:hybrid cluster-associated redox disulfide protein